MYFQSSNTKRSGGRRPAHLGDPTTNVGRSAERRQRKQPWDTRQTVLLTSPPLRHGHLPAQSRSGYPRRSATHRKHAIACEHLARQYIPTPEDDARLKTAEQSRAACDWCGDQVPCCTHTRAEGTPTQRSQQVVMGTVFWTYPLRNEVASRLHRVRKRRPGRHAGRPVAGLR